MVFPTLLSSRSADEIYDLYPEVKPTDCLNKKATDLYSLNWLSITDLENNRDLLDDGQIARLNMLLNTSKHPGNNTHYWFGSALLLSIANFTYANQVCICGTHKPKSVLDWMPCSKWKYCNRCAGKKRHEAYSRYAHIYTVCPEPCYFITITPTNHIPFEYGNYRNILNIWDKLQLYVTSLLERKVIKGALVVEEFAVGRFTPTPTANPHVHIACVGIAGLESYEVEGMKVHVQLIESGEHWDTVLAYMHKALYVVNQYDQEWSEENAVLLNKNFREVMEAHKDVVADRNQIRKIGTFHPLCKKTVVEKKVKRDKKRKRK